MVTQKDIARRLGVSASLVSRALSGTANKIGASPATVERIVREAQRLRYRRNPMAVALRGGSSHILGVVVMDFAGPYFGEMLGLLDHMARARGFSLLVTGYSPSGEGLVGLQQYPLDGVLALGSYFQPRVLQKLVQSGRPVIQIGTGPRVRGVCQVSMDERAGLRKLIDYLAQLGHRRIGYVGHQAPQHRHREEIVRECLAERNLPIRDTWFTDLENFDPAKWASQQDRPTALMATNDVAALQVIQRLTQEGLRVPTDVSVTGIDNITMARWSVPALTTVRQPIQEMIERAVTMLLNQPDECSRAPTPVLIIPELIIRESCGPPIS